MDELNGTPLSGYRTKKTPTVAHLRMHALEENSFENGSIGLVGMAVCLKMIENGRGYAQSGRGFSKFVRASSRIRVYYNPPFRNPGSAEADRIFPRLLVAINNLCPV